MEIIFQKFCLLNQSLQKLKAELQNHPVTEEKRTTLHRELEQLQGSLEALRRKALETQAQVATHLSQFQEMNEQIVSMYRVIEERFEEHKITLISKEALELSSSLQSGKMIKIAKQVNQLNHNIHFLFQHRMPSLAHRKIVNLARKLAKQAEKIISSNTSISKAQKGLIQLLKTLLEDALQRVKMMISPEEAELAMELYEIADLLSHKKENEGRLRMSLIRSRLSKVQQQRLDAAEDSPKELIRILLEIAQGDTCPEWTQNFSYAL